MMRTGGLGEGDKVKDEMPVHRFGCGLSVVAG